jgi:hypothetical protein
MVPAKARAGGSLPRWTKAGIFFVTRLKENADYLDFEVATF